MRYGGLTSSTNHKLAQKYCDGKPASLLSFGIKGGLAKTDKFYDALEVFKRLINIGDSKSLTCHPASTSQMTPEEQKQTGVTEDLVRLCIGIEPIDDILADLDQALVTAK
ncbi:MAG: PLP-dependent transferase [Reichenbachiella sp.]|uniref:PLP-dependent transferase n=1 Tax=Reichenbachiella sp. TaxID=2184521 RepID=UPI0032672ED1